MKRYLTWLMLILTASFFVLACQDTSDSSNGTNSGIEDGGSGGDGGTGDGGGSSLDSEIINATMRVSADENDALTNTFFSPAVATNGGKLQYIWDFGDNTESISTDYNYIKHQFNKYGKTYTVKLLLNNMSSSQQETVTMDLSLPKPELSINCNTSGALLFCNPVISQQGIQDVSYTWNIFDSTGKLETEILSTGPSIINHRVADSGTYRIVLKGTSAQVDGEMTAEREIYVSVNINQGQITYSNTSSDMLSYKYTFNAQAIDGSQLEYCWDFDGTARCDEGIGFQLGAQYSIADHTYSKYNAANTVTAFARIPGTNDIVSNAIIIQQALPEVNINAEGTGLERNFSPVFSFKPKGNISYIWKTGDGKEYSQETVNHTYIKNGTYTAELTVLNDLFAPEIGAVSAKPLNIYAYDNIQNVVIEYSRVNQSIEGETYTFSTPAISDNGKLYYIWKIDNAVVAEGENLSSISHIFTKFGQTASVSLELKLAGSNEIVSAEPVLVQTSKPVAVLNPPANITVNVPVEFKGEILSHLNGQNFAANLVNPQYKLEVSNTEYKYSDTLTIPYTFITRGTYSPKLVVTAENVEGSIISEPVTVKANEVLIACRNEANPADIYSVKVICQAENILDKTLKYSLTYQEYINDVYTTMEYGVEDTAEIILYHREKNDIYNENIRNIIVSWEIYKDAASSENLGTYQYKNIVQEPAMGQVVDVLMKSEKVIEDGSFVIYYDVAEQKFIEEGDVKYIGRGIQSTYALDNNGKVYSWGNLAGGQYDVNHSQLKPKLVNLINGKVVKMWNDAYIDVFQLDNGEKYIAYNQQQYLATFNKTIRYAYLYNLKGMEDKQIKFLIRPDNSKNNTYNPLNLYFLGNNELFYMEPITSSMNKLNSGIVIPEKIELDDTVKKILYQDSYYYIITNKNSLYRIFEPKNGKGQLEKLKDNVVDFGQKINGRIVSIVNSDGSTTNMPYTSNDNIVQYNGSIIYHIYYNDNYFIKGNDNKLYHNNPNFSEDYNRRCASGLGTDLSDNDYRKVLPINIPEEVVSIIPGNGIYAVTVSGKVYRWDAYRGSCTPELMPDIIIDSKIKQQIGNFILLGNGKILHAYNAKYVVMPNDVTIKEIKEIEYYHDNSDINARRDERICAVANTGEVYWIYEDKEVLYDRPIIIEQVSNINIKDNIKNLFQSGGTYIILLTNAGEVFNIYPKNATKINGLPNNIKYIHFYMDTFLAYTEDNKIYGWGFNYGLLPVGDTAPRETAVLLNLPAYKKHLGVDRTSSIKLENVYDGRLRRFYTIFTEDGSIYSWGAVEGTGTEEQENITMDGYVTKPTKVN